jgi:uncharacterized integral membrane protein
MSKKGMWIIILGMMLLGLVEGADVANAQTVTGNVILWTAAFPGDLRVDRFEDDEWAYLFTEQIGLALPEDVIVNAVAPGTYDEDRDLGRFTIPKDTKVDVYLLHSDPRRDGPKDYAGSIAFPTEIVGVIVQSGKLERTDSVLGVTGTRYSQSGYRGLELDTQRVEQFTISDDRKTLTFSFRTTNAVDELRILISAPTFSLGDYVWLDDGDGIQETGEPGIGGVPVWLFEGSCDLRRNYNEMSPWAGTSTDENGFYEFTDLGRGDYCVIIPRSAFGTGGPLAGRDPTNGTLQSEDYNYVYASATLRNANDWTIDFGFVSGAPTAVTLASLSARSGAGWPVGALAMAVVGVLLMSGAAARRHWR